MWWGIYDNPAAVLLFALGLVVSSTASAAWAYELWPKKMRTVARWTAVYLVGCSRVYRVEGRR